MMISFQVKNIQELNQPRMDQWFQSHDLYNQFREALADNNYFSYLKKVKGIDVIEHVIVNFGFNKPSQFIFIVNVVDESEFIKSLCSETDNYIKRNNGIWQRFLAFLSIRSAL